MDDLWTCIGRKKDKSLPAVQYDSALGGDMERLTAKDFDPELLGIFDKYVHGDIDRRGFFDRAGKFAIGGTTVAMLLDMLSPKFAEAQQVPKDDKRIKTEWVEINRRAAPA
jgi:carboxymethylenebutenolidase